MGTTGGWGAGAVGGLVAPPSPPQDKCIRRSGSRKVAPLARDDLPHRCSVGAPRRTEVLFVEVIPDPAASGS